MRTGGGKASKYCVLVCVWVGNSDAIQSAMAVQPLYRRDNALWIRKTLKGQKFHGSLERDLTCQDLRKGLENKKVLSCVYCRIDSHSTDGDMSLCALHPDSALAFLGKRNLQPTIKTIKTIQPSPPTSLRTIQTSVQANTELLTYCL